MLGPARAFADSTRDLLRQPAQSPLQHAVRTPDVRGLRALRAHDAALRQAGLRHRHASVNGVKVPVHERIVWERPFCSIINFDRELGDLRVRQPKLLIVAPMSGHYATLLRGTVEAFVGTHDVYITDWVDARAGAAERGPLRSRRLHRLRHLDAPRAGAGRARHGGLPALRARDRRRRADGGRERLRAPRSMTLMGGPDRHARQPDRRSTCWPRSAASSGSAATASSRCRCPTPASCATSIPASCSSPASWR